MEKLNAIKPEGVLDYYAALGVKADDEDEEEEDESDGIPPLDLTDQGPQPENAEYNRLMEYLAGISKRLDALEKANEAE